MIQKIVLSAFLAAVATSLLRPQPTAGQVYNLKIITDARPDYSDMESMVRSIAAKWSTPREKCWALYYWNHFARRQTTPMVLHGYELTDPIRQFNDYGFTQCSTIAGINCAIWNYMGYKCHFWDIANHTVPEVEYEGRYHMFDDSMSNLCTLCDGKTIAGVEDIWEEVGCEASGGAKQRGHRALYHSLYATSPKGYLQGSDDIRSLAGWGACFRNRNQPKGFYNQEWGHRYILNLLPNAVYSRSYCRIDGGGRPVPEDRKQYKNDVNAFVTNPEVKDFGGDGESPNPRYRIRGVGQWEFLPDLSAEGLARQIVSQRNIHAVQGGLAPVAAGQPAEVIFKVNSANATTSLTVDADFVLRTDQDRAKLSVSTNNGRTWKQVWASQPRQASAKVNLRDEVNGLYETLIRVELLARSQPRDALLKSLGLKAMTEFNTKTNPALNWGQNTVYVGAGDQSESIVYWPDLRGDKWKPYASDSGNMTTGANEYGVGNMFPAKRGHEGYVVFRMDAPADITRVTYGGRFAVLNSDSRVELCHSFDEGKTWTTDWTLAQAAPDIVHYPTLDKVPPGTRTVLYKYAALRDAAKRPSASIYAVRMEADYAPAAKAVSGPIEVTFAWKERQDDYTLKPRSHTQAVTTLPFKYVINVGGADHPVMEALAVRLVGARSVAPPATPSAKLSYSDGHDRSAVKWMPTWATVGKNLALGKPYSFSVPPVGQWSAQIDPATCLTDGVIGSLTANGGGIGWTYDLNPQIVVDLGQAQTCGAFRAAITCGWPWWDALKGEVKDKIEVLTSMAGKQYALQGQLRMNMRFKDVPANVMLPDDEGAGGFIAELVLPKGVQARYVKFKVTSPRIMQLMELQVFDWIRYEPFDLRLSLPDDKP